MKYLLVILFILPVLAFSQVTDTCFTTKELQDVAFTIDSLSLADSVNNVLITQQRVSLASQARLISLDSLELTYKTKQIELLKTNINIYVAREKEFLPKWYDNKMLYFTGGIVSTLLTTNLILKVFKQ
jgi:hypothetical protein